LWIKPESLRPADHRHQGVDSDQARNGLDQLRRHDVEAKPADRQDPCAEGKEWNVRGRVCGDQPIAGVAAAAGAEQQHCGQRNPAAQGMNHDRAGEIMESMTEGAFEPRLNAIVAVPGHALEKWFDETDQDKSCRQFRIEACPLGDSAGYDGRDSGCEGQQEEELDQVIAVFSASTSAPEKKLTP
jgi:hypothetical protein